MQARLRKYLGGLYIAFSRTVIGDAVATAVAMSFISLGFFVCVLALIALSRAIGLAFGAFG